MLSAKNNVKMYLRGRLISGIVAISFFLSFTLALASTVFADASANASCMGIEASEISPPGSNNEFLGGVPEFGEFIKLLADAFGLPPGALISTIAKLHLGSHELCYLGLYPD